MYLDSTDSFERMTAYFKAFHTPTEHCCLSKKNAKCAGVGITGFMWSDPGYSNFRMAGVRCPFPLLHPWQTSLMDQCSLVGPRHELMTTLFQHLAPIH